MMYNIFVLLNMCKYNDWTGSEVTQVKCKFPPNPEILLNDEPAHYVI
jgi:hypothetical protein